MSHRGGIPLPGGMAMQYTHAQSTNQNALTYSNKLTLRKIDTICVSR